MIDITELKMLMRGREHDFLMYAGIPADVVNNKKHQPCACGGKDRLRITKEGGFFCNQGSSGDYFDLIEHYHGLIFKESIKLAADFLGLRTATNREKLEIKKRAEKERKKAEIESLIKTDNAKLDFDLRYNMDTLSILMSERKDNKLPSDEEIKACDDLILSLRSRYKGIYKKREWVERLVSHYDYTPKGNIVHIPEKIISD